MQLKVKQNVCVGNALPSFEGGKVRGKRQSNLVKQILKAQKILTKSVTNITYDFQRLVECRIFEKKTYTITWEMK